MCVYSCGQGFFFSCIRILLEGRNPLKHTHTMISSALMLTTMAGMLGRPRAFVTKYAPSKARQIASRWVGDDLSYHHRNNHPCPCLCLARGRTASRGGALLRGNPAHRGGPPLRQEDHGPQRVHGSSTAAGPGHTSPSPWTMTSSAFRIGLPSSDPRNWTAWKKNFIRSKNEIHSTRSI